MLSKLVLLVCILNLKESSENHFVVGCGNTMLYVFKKYRILIKLVVLNEVLFSNN